MIFKPSSNCPIMAFASLSDMLCSCAWTRLERSPYSMHSMARKMYPSFSNHPNSCTKRSGYCYPWTPNTFFNWGRGGNLLTAFRIDKANSSLEFIRTSFLDICFTALRAPLSSQPNNPGSSLARSFSCVFLPDSGGVGTVALVQFGVVKSVLIELTKLTAHSSFVCFQGARLPRL